MYTNLADQTIGELKQQREGYKAFIPYPFPPKPGFSFDATILKKNEEATRLLGKLDGITKLLPDSDFFLLMYLRKDAASSSQIEGTMATMVDAIDAEVQTRSDIPEDVDDILHYIKALNFGIDKVQRENFPFALRFIKDLHRELMKGARATHFPSPGEFRTSQNWIGGTNPNNAKFVPPPVREMTASLNDLESFINTVDSLPAVIKSGVIHSQFELIHPFLDGNGRTGRMLITFYLWKEKFVEKPVLFLSSYFKKHQATYYERLEDYGKGKVDRWIDFFLDGVIEIATEAIDIVGKITELRQRDMEKIQKLGKRASESAVPILKNLYAQPIVNISTMMKWTGFSAPGAQKVIDRFIELGILSQRDEDKKYGRSYIYKDYVRIFAEE
jgi:Fic family protein